MNDKIKNLRQHAMYFGTLMGLFWIIKFTFIPIGFRIPLLQILFILMTLFVPVLGYIYTRRYRDKYCEGEVSFLNAMVFSLFMYFFASMLSAAGHYIYFRFIDNGYIINTYLDMMEEVRSNVTGEMETYINNLIENLEKISSLSSVQITMQLFSQNIFYGTLLSVPTALFAKLFSRKKQF